MDGKSPSIYLSDHWAKTDGLNFKVFMPALMDIIRNAETPLTVGVFGTWGSGKTSLLRMLEKQIRDDGLSNFRPVWFTAWKYDKQEALWRAFILRVMDELYPKDSETGERILKDDLADPNQQKGVDYLDRLTESLYQTVSWQGEASWSFDWQQTGKEMIKLPFWLGLHLVKLGDAAKDLGLTPELAELIGREAPTHYMQQLTSMEQFEDKFEQAIKKILGEDGRLVVFVDDLDRCLPEKAIEILEAIKLFLHVPQTIFILGMDRDIVRRGIESYYGMYMHDSGKPRPDLPIDGDSYLQKLIQLPFNLPTLNEIGRKDFIKTLQEELEENQKLDEITRQVFATGLLPNPRQVKRALNVFNLLRKIAEEQENENLIPKGSVAWPLLAKTVLIQSQWPDLYALWRSYPTLIIRLEEEYGKHPLTDREVLMGEAAPVQRKRPEGIEAAPAGAESSAAQEKKGGILGEYLNQRSKYALLNKLFIFPEETGEGRKRARFAGLTRTQLQVYLGLAGTADVEVSEEILAELPTDLNEMLQSGDTALIQDALSQIDEQEKEPQGPLHEGAVNTLVGAARSDGLEPGKRAASADAADKWGYVPDDLYSFVSIPDAQSPQFLIARYPVTNALYERFLQPENFTNKDLWCAFPKFDEESRPMGTETFGEEGWDWLQEAIQDKDNLVEKGVLYPRYWGDNRFGGMRPSAPVVGVSWYEANAYSKWLLAHWEEEEEGQHQPQPQLVRLPTRAEWVLAAGGETPEERFPWDAVGKAGTSKGEDEQTIAEVVRRANVVESKVSRTTPVWMYPQGASQPHGVMDLGGNMWEWHANYYDQENNRMMLSGGSWFGTWGSARVSPGWADDFPYNSNLGRGFRVFVLPGFVF